jgi:hypothetical protein
VSCYKTWWWRADKASLRDLPVSVSPQRFVRNVTAQRLFN